VGLDGLSLVYTLNGGHTDLIRDVLWKPQVRLTKLEKLTYICWGRWNSLLLVTINRLPDMQRFRLSEFP
jgi:hypothetical protein